MTKCLTCENDVTEPKKQYGETSAPICLSCWLAGLAWVYNDAVIVDELQHGASLDEVKQAVDVENIKAFNEFAQSLFVVVMEE